MQLHLHPRRREALTASDTMLTRWSLATNPATILAQYSTAPETVFDHMYLPNGRLVASGGITSSPDGLLFAHEQLLLPGDWWAARGVIEWRSFDDLSSARVSPVPITGHQIESLASSPDARWLVLGIGPTEQLFLLDWQTGEIISSHAADGYNISGLTFDPTSTFVAGLFSHQGGGFLQLWRLNPAERFVQRPAQAHIPLPQDGVCGRMALTLVHRDLEPWKSAWPKRDLANIMGMTAFSPDSRLVVFCLFESGFELLAYEVESGKQLWGDRSEQENTGPCLFTPDGNWLLVPVEGGDLQVYRVEDGTLAHQLPSHLDEPVQALAFDHDGRTLWLATEERLVQYQPCG